MMSQRWVTRSSQKSPVLAVYRAGELTDELDNVNAILENVSFLCADFRGGSSTNSGVVFAAAVSALVLRAGMVLDRQLAAAGANTGIWAERI